MPDIKKDSDSGALIFVLTPTEKDVQNLKASYTDILKRLEQVEKLTKGGGKNGGNTSTSKSK